MSRAVYTDLKTAIQDAQDLANIRCENQEQRRSVFVVQRRGGKMILARKPKRFMFQVRPQKDEGK